MPLITTLGSLRQEVMWLGRERNIRREETEAQSFSAEEMVRGGCGLFLCFSDLSAFTPIYGSRFLLRPIRICAIVGSRSGMRKPAPYLVNAWTPGHCQPKLCLHAWPGLSGEWGRSCYSGLMLISPDSCP